MFNIILVIIGIIIGIVLTLVITTFEEDYRDYDDTIDLP